MTDVPFHRYTLGSKISLTDWVRIQAAFYKVHDCFRNTEPLKDQALGTIHIQGDDEVKLLYSNFALSINRAWPDAWYGTMCQGTITRCSDGFDLFQRACLLVVAHHARLSGVEFIIRTEGSHKGWVRAAQLVALATGDRRAFGKAGFIRSLMDAGALVPVASKVNGSEKSPVWASEDVDRNLMSLTDSLVVTVAPGNEVWPSGQAWFF